MLYPLRAGVECGRQVNIFQTFSKKYEFQIIIAIIEISIKMHSNEYKQA